jgi:hypothetical protein
MGVTLRGRKPIAPVGEEFSSSWFRLTPSDSQSREFSWGPSKAIGLVNSLHERPQPNSGSVKLPWWQ